ncbi:MAG: TauD/TfdA family dioxygenase [Pseudomonadota bacterium]
MSVVEQIEVPDQQANPEVFPYALAPTEAMTLEASLVWIRSSRESLADALAKHGAVLLRGFPWRSDQDFDAAIQAFGQPNFTYAESLSNAVRINRTERVFTANEAPPDVSIFMHHEMAQTPVFPAQLFFFCEKAAEVDGQTPVCRSDWLLQRLERERADFVTRCRELGVRYRNSMPDADDAKSGQGRSWRSTLKVDSRDAAESRLKTLGYDWQWQDDGALSFTSPALPAIRQLKCGREVFFNQLIAAFRGWQDAEKSILFGDYSPIDPEDMSATSAIADELTFDIPWEAGDLVVVDNFLVMHGRRPYQGKRCILVSLVANDGSRLAA